MPYVEFYKLNNDGSQEVIAKCELANGEIVCGGDENLTANLKSEGILDYLSGEVPGRRGRLFFKDGRKFLENLKYNFSSGYLNASDIKE